MTSSTKRKRRTKSEIEAIKADILAVIDPPMTVRQIFYQLVSRGSIAKTEAEYRGTVCRLLTEMRRSGDIPYDCIADNTRWMRKPPSYASLADALEHTQEYYRRALWASQDSRVEIWLEKDALAGVLYRVTSEWDVPLMVTRGYPSLSFLHAAAEEIQYSGKPTHLFYFGDRDPSGVDIPRVVEKRIRELAPDADFTCQVVAVTPEQIEKWNLPTRPTKQTDTRSAKFQGESVEVDAIPASELRSLAEQCILRHVDSDALRRMRAVEDAERDTLQGLVDGFKAA